MSIPKDKYRELAEKLYNSTLDKSLHWQQDPFSEDLFTSLGKYKICLYSNEDAEGSPYIRVVVKNQAGEEVDSFTDSTISGATPNVYSIQSYWVLLNNLYTMAHRKAKGADEALDEVLSALDFDDDVPF